MPIARHLEIYHITSIFNSEEGPVKKISNEKILHSPLCSLDVIRGGKNQEEVHFAKHTSNFE